jgi:hypothetical protein
MDTYQVIEDNAGGMYLFFFDGNKVILGVENIEFVTPGDLDNVTLDEAKTWDSQLDNPQSHYDNITSYEFGWQVVADQNGIYPAAMGRAAQIAYRKVFYPILLEYVGPPNSNIAAHLKKRIRVESKPGRKNLSGQPCTTGWLGTTNDWSETALGEVSEDECRELLKERGVKIPDTSSVKFTDYSFGNRFSEKFNREFAY